MSMMHPNGIFRSKEMIEGLYLSKTYADGTNAYGMEPDGSAWLLIMWHNNPASSLFSSSDNFNSCFSKTNILWRVPLINKILDSEYEFMIQLKETSSSTTYKYRWIQYKNPYDAVFGDVDPADVSKITTTGYTAPGSNYGGIYKLNNSNSFIVANNGTNGNWWGAIGAQTAFQGGIPGYDGKVITTGWMNLYIRIDDIRKNLEIVKDRDGPVPSELIEL